MSDAIHQLNEPERQLHELTPLGSRQIALVGVLSDKSDNIAAMYVGAIMARGAEDNPDHLSQACHSVRELIDNLPNYFDVPVERTGRLTDQANALHDQWKREPRVKKGNSDPLTERFAKKLTEFFQWIDENIPKRREVARKTIQQLDPSRRSLPRPIEDLRAKEWMRIRQFFVDATHHGKCSRDDFDNWLDVLETFVLNLTRPRTFENADAIDALIREGESDA
jgi:hypothetical protein